MQQGIITKARAKPRNVLRGVVPTATTFSTPPTDLANCTDGDNTTKTGIGEKETTGGSVYGYLTFDLGSSKLVQISGLYSTYSSTGNTFCYLNYGEQSNFSDARAALLSSKTAATTESAGLGEQTYSPIIKARYIRLEFKTSTAATGYAVIYSLRGHELGL